MPNLIENNSWDGVDRRKGISEERRHEPPAPADIPILLIELLQKVESLSQQVHEANTCSVDSKTSIARLESQLTTHIKEEEKLILGIVSAFPEKDFSAHFSYHDQKAKAAKSWSEILLDLKKKVLGGVVWALIVGTALALWEYLKTEVKK